MRKIVFCAFVIALTCFLPVAAGGLYHSRGATAEATFATWDESGVVTVVWMIAFEYRDQSPPGNGTKGAGLVFEAYRYDTTTGNLLFDGYTFKELLPEEFRIDRKLTQASLTTQVDCTDWVSGNPLTFVVDLTLNAIGAPVRENQHQHFKGPNFKVNYHWTGVSRDAEAVGTVFLGTENLTPDPSDYAALRNTKSMEVWVE